MSDPAKRDENVEDIVSSIRRLVSDTDRSDAEGTSAAEPETTTPEPPKSDMTDGRDALLLTPDQRVGQSAAAPEPPTGPQGSESKLGSLRQAVNGAFSGEPVLPAVVHATHPVKRPDGQGWPSQPPADYYEDQEEEGAVSASEDASAAAPAPQSEPDAPQDVAEGAPPAEEAATGGDDAPAVHEETPDPDEMAADLSSSEEELDIPDQPSSDLNTAASAEVHMFNERAAESGEDWRGQVDELSEEEMLTSAAEPAEEAPVATFRHRRAEERGLRMVPDMTEPEADAPAEGPAAEFAEDPVQPEPDLAELDLADDVVTQTAPVEALPAEEGATEEMIENTDLADEDHADDGLSDAPEAAPLGELDETVLDEDMLRELVSEIVRQELSGELGERITRNVRKLVRREIHRALLTREFD